MGRTTSREPTGVECFKHVTEAVLGLEADCGILRALRRQGYTTIGSLYCLSPGKLAFYEDVDDFTGAKIPIPGWHKELVASVLVFRDARRLHGFPTMTASDWMAVTAEDFDEFGSSKEWKGLAVLVQEECALETPIIASTTAYHLLDDGIFDGINGIPRAQ